MTIEWWGDSSPYANVHYRLGDRVNARVPTIDHPFPAHVIKVHDDDSYEVRDEDTQFIHRVTYEQMRPIIDVSPMCRALGVYDLKHTSDWKGTVIALTDDGAQWILEELPDRGTGRPSGTWGMRGSRIDGIVELTPESAAQYIYEETKTADD